MRTYAEALAYLYSFANYETSRMTPRTDRRLVRMRHLLELAGSPDRRFRSVLIAGTKGKGSTAAMLASISQASGLRTGLYSQPHLNSHRERIRVQGELISKEALIERVRWLRKTVVGRYAGDHGPPTTYELGTIVAFEHFARENVDLAVVEVGLGGRLDATNVIEPELSVFTPISYDHMEVLGPTLTSIATEKAGIIKPGRPVVTSSQPPEAMAVLRSSVQDRGASLHLAEPLMAAGPAVRVRAGFALPELSQRAILPHTSTTPAGRGIEIRLPLLGKHQLTNAGVAVASARLLALNEDAIPRGLEAVRWPGRLEVLRELPLVIADGAHNVDSMEKLALTIRHEFEYDRLRLILGFSADKDIPGMAGVLNNLGARTFITQSTHPRSASPLDIVHYFRDATVCSTLDDAVAGQQPRELAVVSGSLFLAGDARLHFGVVGPEDQDEL